MQNQFAIHDVKLNLLLTLRPDQNLVSVQTLVNLKKLGWGQKTDLLTALNSANGMHWLCTFNAAEPFASVSATTFIYLAERISRRDIIALLEDFNGGVIRVFNASGLSRFTP